MGAISRGIELPRDYHEPQNVNCSFLNLLEIGETVTSLKRYPEKPHRLFTAFHSLKSLLHHVRASTSWPRQAVEREKRLRILSYPFALAAVGGMVASQLAEEDGWKLPQSPLLVLHDCSSELFRPDIVGAVFSVVHLCKCFREGSPKTLRHLEHFYLEKSGRFIL